MQSSHLWRLTVGSPSFTSVHTGRVVHLILESLVMVFFGSEEDVMALAQSPSRLGVTSGYA